ncbi:AP-1-like transcription factor [Ophidiomyces ophidiicola]|nr:AP-1-like transcription factor [Ophidiomyces ophidiicola]KAI1966544.1 AP-1-like transcription factor [Ophidiomyces ophidiicola]
MDYSYYASAHPHQAYQFYGLQHPQPGAPTAEQFQDVPPMQQQNGFQVFQPYGFEPSVHGSRHVPDILPPEPFRTEFLDPTSHDSSDNKLTDSSVLHPSTATENSDEPILDPSQNQRSSSEEKDNLTPAQSRRKAQNRAAQRAFRERKERRVRNLEQELTEYKQNMNSLLEDNECLKRQIAKVATENEILRATSSANRCSESHREPSPVTTGPMRYSPTDYPLPTHHKKSTPVHRIRVHETTGEKLLDASATWDLIVNRLADEKVRVDVQDIYNRLKGHAICDGTGPVLEEARVKKAIEESIAAGKDELI